MANIFIISDTHFGHLGVTQFMNNDGTKMRPWDDVYEMDEALVKNWNSVVKPKDKVYHLGDVVINRKALPILSRLNGEKVLVKGNHDIFRIEEYLEYFKDVRGSHIIDKYVMTHIPIHTASIERWKGNIHGHLHSNVISIVKQVIVNNGERGSHVSYEAIPDPKYFCASVEQINYTPIAFEDIKKIMEGRNK